MNKIDKFLKKLKPKEKEALILLLLQIKKDHSKIPGLKKLKGKNDYYRVRFSQYRIIFIIKKSGTEIRRITKRNDSTYKDL